MKTNKKTNYLYLVVATLGLSALACGYLKIGMVEPTPEEPTPQLVETESDPVEQADPTSEENLPQSIPVVAWLGKISSLPESSQFDDFVSLSPQGSGEFGLTGATEALEAEIRSLRDAEGPQEFIHFWGSLACEGIDYNGCQLVVDRMQYGASYSEEDISGWVGVIRSSTFNSASSCVFELSGDFPIWYSIYASQDESLKGEIESLRDTGALVRVSGRLLIGIPDVNGTRIEVSSLEVLQAGTEEKPELADSNPLTEGWPTFVNDRYHYQIKYPPDAVLEFFGPIGFDNNELPEGMDAETYLAELTKLYTDRLCVGIRYSLGIIYISAPPNQGTGYTPCGPTGVGAGEIINSEALIKIDSQTYQVKTMEIILAGSGSESYRLNYHSEMNYLLLDDNTRIFFGSIPRQDATYEDYLMKTRETLLLILSTYHKN